MTANITPSPPSRVQGFLKGNTPAQAVASPLLLQLVLIEDHRGNKTLIGRADVFGFSDEIVRMVRTELRRWGLPPEAILLNASHTHYAPGTTDSTIPSLGPYYPGYAREIAEAIIERVPRLYEQLEPCRIFRAQATGQIGVNRTGENDNQLGGSPRPEGYYHRSTPLLILELTETDRRVLIVNHGCHPTGVSKLPGLFADYPGFLRAVLLQSDSLDDVIFLQGAAGSSKQIVKKGTSFRWASEVRDVKENAIRLARSVGEGLQNELTPVEGAIYARRTSFALKMECAHPREAFERLIDLEESPPWEQQWAKRCLERFDLKNEPATYPLPYETHLLSLGPEAVFLTFPGEPTAEMARLLVERTHLDHDPLILGYTNGLHSYLPTAELIERSCYEAGISQKMFGLPGPFTLEIEDAVAGAVEENLNAWHESDRPNGYGRFHLRTDPPSGSAFFCLSTGRCGTRTLSKALDTAENARVYHHPRPFLIEETLRAYHEELDRRATFRRTRGTIMRDAWRDDLRFGEVDHNMTPFAPAIQRELPEARFLVLVRNPWGFVRSGMRRGYYRGHPWDSGRLRPEAGHPDAECWPEWTAFQKVCWLWGETYERIADYLREIPADRVRLIRFEDLIEGPATTKKLFDFLELEGFDVSQIEDVLSQKHNAQKSGEFPRPDQWSPELHEVLWTHAREAIRRLDLGSYSRMRDRYARASEREA